MSVLVLAVGGAYTQICRIYPDGGGVYTAAKHKSRTLAVVGALLLFADYMVTASGQAAGVPVIPFYDSGGDVAERMAEAAAVYGCETGADRHEPARAVAPDHQGSFQRQLESMLPPEVAVQVVAREGEGEPALTVTV